MARKEQHQDKASQASQNEALANADYLVWRVTRGKQRVHDREVTRLYNQRARQRPETRH